MAESKPDPIEAGIIPLWSAVVTYKTDAGSLEVTHDIEELEELQVERGPDWNAIIKIEIILARRSYDVTIEQAEEM